MWEKGKHYSGTKLLSPKKTGILWTLGKWKVFLISEKWYNFYIVQNSICKKQPPSTVPYIINGITVRGQTQSSTDLLDFLLIVSNITSSPTVGRYFAIVIWYMEFYIINCLGSLLIWWLMLYSPVWVLGSRMPKWQGILFSGIYHSGKFSCR